ncbi:hypothetical protein PIB30_032668 [Stylosanthes scabra]|uniref:Uncharacterized protein n=1 Tax=Stylosanthes scabra TaxID=79078 RepID=A0ABU6XAS1_9FABA|nr:hypothetical protein [Stylosanthes scabra]
MNPSRIRFPLIFIIGSLNVGKRALLSQVDGYGISESEGSSSSGDIRKSCLEWCTENNIEACASNADFDKCLSVDGDSQGVERLFGALSAHMWPGMMLKSDNRTNESLLPVKEELSSEESDYELEYEFLSAGSAELWDDTEQRWVSATSLDAGGSDESDKEVVADMDDLECEKSDTGKVGNMRSSLRLMPDFQREMDAKLAMKMASVFGGESDEEEKIGSI